MAIIIDTNCLSKVFCSTNKAHKDFEPVFRWIIEGNGFVVYGGSKYFAELKKIGKFIKLFTYLSTLGKAVRFCNKQIDELQQKYEAMISDSDFDDPHLPAIVCVSKCRIICSCDKRSIPFVANKDLYPKRFRIPKYYTGLKDKGLLIDSNIDRRLANKKNKLSKKDINQLNKFISTLK